MKMQWIASDLDQVTISQIQTRSRTTSVVSPAGGQPSDRALIWGLSGIGVQWVY